MIDDIVQIEELPSAHNGADKPPRLAFSVTSGRVGHYADVVEQMVQQQIAKCQEEGWNPSKVEIDFYRKEVIRYAIVRHDLDTATKLKMQKRQTLNG